MSIMQLMLTRKSVRTFASRHLSANDLQELKAYAEEIQNPYGIPVNFVFLDARKHDLTSAVVEGESYYVAGKVVKQDHCEEAFGHSFEQLVLFALSLDVGTTLIGRTMNRDAFELAADVKPDERMYLASPLGYPAQQRSAIDTRLRASVKSDERRPASQLFFNGNFSTPLAEATPEIAAALEAVRWAPSASNRQPWRIVKEGDAFHFYVDHTPGYARGAYGDVQKIDMGIALCHFMLATHGGLRLLDPGIASTDSLDYIATVVV